MTEETSREVATKASRVLREAQRIIELVQDAKSIAAYTLNQHEPDAALARYDRAYLLLRKQLAAVADSTCLHASRKLRKRAELTLEAVDRIMAGRDS